IGLSLAAVFLLLTVLGAWFASTRPVAAIDQTKLENYQKSLRSYTAESQLLANQAKDQRTLSDYQKVSAEKLYFAASDVAEKLQTEPPDAGLSQQVGQTADQAADLTDTLSRLSGSPDEDELDDILSSLSDIRSELDWGGS
ncbi:MAG TPA: hypothetical protein VM535_02035, partial [Candidatus Saccharimonadales bacterium]|nr:hypothetical protein [Candidatus Saccharimonadales bacterium]